MNKVTAGEDGDIREEVIAEDQSTRHTTPRFVITDVIPEKKLSFEEASKCLNTLGKDESGIRYAYLMITATDKKLTDVSVILNFKHVLFLDLSNNFLTLESLEVLTKMPFLILLKAEQNRIESAALTPMPYLQVLDLNHNQITETCDINQPLLDCLELHHNFIYTAQFDVERLEALKQLELRGNQLLDISGTYPLTIEKLYLANNRIKKIDTFDFSKLTQLITLHLRDNNLRKLKGFSECLVNLKYLNLRNNNINKIRQFRKLVCLPKLETLIITGNPVISKQEETKETQDEELDDDTDVVNTEDKEDDEAGEDELEEEGNEYQKQLRISLLVLLPNLKRINKEMVTLKEREEAFKKNSELLSDIMGEVSSEDETEPATTVDVTTTYTSGTDLPLDTDKGTDEGQTEDEEEDDIEEKYDDLN